MYYFKLNSFFSEYPVYQRLHGEKDCYFVAENRVARDYVHSGFHEGPYIDWAVSTFAKPDKNIIDIGAHIGIYSLPFGRISNKVYSFECSPKSFNYLCANIALHDLNYKIEKYNIALSNQKGISKYYIRDPKDGGGNGISFFDYDKINNVPNININTCLLDEYDITNVNFIKIDVEGHEKEVLQGSIKTLENNEYPPILFESWDSFREKEGYPAIKLRNELFDYITSLEYNIRTIVGNSELFLAERK